MQRYVIVMILRSSQPEKVMHNQSVTHEEVKHQEEVKRKVPHRQSYENEECFQVHSTQNHKVTVEFFQKRNKLTWNIAASVVVRKVYELPRIL